ncbi:hypothetical protein SAMN05720467_0695 [Fibrobacter sp. UWB7]|nr:hypothetical protein SAMN05720467_0695 [Fibrobacter sp. UWB7]
MNRRMVTMLDRNSQVALGMVQGLPFVLLLSLWPSIVSGVAGNSDTVLVASQCIVGALMVTTVFAAIYKLVASDRHYPDKERLKNQGQLGIGHPIPLASGVFQRPMPQRVFMKFNNLFFKKVYVKDSPRKFGMLVHRSSERHVSNIEAVERVSNCFEGRNGWRMFENGNFCFDTGFQTSSGENLVCYCVPNRFRQDQAFCVGFGTLADYGVAERSFAAKIWSLLKMKIF